MSDRTIQPADVDYPPALLELGQPPDPLYLRGTLRPSMPLVAIVGTRAATPAGHAFAERLASDLARLGIGVISGGARGIDGAAHDGALTANGYTIVVVATGCDVAYPREHEALFARIVAAGGCILSERAPGSQPVPPAFPARNRIVAALAACTVVVEAPARSGALSTARAAAGLGRPVLAVPGRPDDPKAAGCLALVRAGALICAGAGDVLDVLARPSTKTAVSQIHIDLRESADPTVRGARPARRKARTAEPRGAVASRPVPAETRIEARAPADEDERTLLSMLEARERDFDELCVSSGLGAARVRAALSMLGLAGIVIEKPGDRYARAYPSKPLR